MRKLTVLAVIGILCVSAVRGEEGKPRITRVYQIDTDILALEIYARKIEYGEQTEYKKQDGDAKKKEGHQNVLVRNGKTAGALCCKNDSILMSYDRVTGIRLDTGKISDPSFYTIISADDPLYREGTHPLNVFRKSKPTGMARKAGWQWDSPALHIIYLVLPGPLLQKKTYNIEFRDSYFPGLAFVPDTSSIRSEAVHVSHTGFHPEDPVKFGFLSCWLGDGGNHAYEKQLPFEILDTEGKPVFSGTAQLYRVYDDPEDPYRKNYTKTDVYRIDFSKLKKAGEYRIHVHGVGCSYPFRITDNAWGEVFRIAAKGFYYQRSGIAIEKPYAEKYTRPRCFHPDDGVRVYQSTTPLMDSGNGLNARGKDKNNFEQLVAGKTDEIVPNAWGGYFDAGDWDRRIQHLEATRLILELYELFPEYMKTVKLNIPESSNKLPDILDEALWNLSFFRRMQTPEGGVRGGIESSEHPKYGECSWQESLTVMAYAPGMWSSYVYAGDAARAAGILERIAPDLSVEYRKSSIAAMAYAEKAFADNDYEKIPYAVTDARNLASAELYRLTGEEIYHEIFLKTTVFIDPKADLYKWKFHEQRDAAFVYFRIKDYPVNKDVWKNVFNAMKREADLIITQCDKTAFSWTKNNPWAPLGWGNTTAPPVKTLLRVYSINKEGKYLEKAIAASQFALGANPSNLCYTTGVGHAYPIHPLVVDARTRGMLPPPGITVYGPLDLSRQKNYWALKVLSNHIYPDPQQWPSAEGYFDVFMFPAMTEFTVMQTMGPFTYLTGYLAAVSR